MERGIPSFTAPQNRTTVESVPPADTTRTSPGTYRPMLFRDEVFTGTNETTLGTILINVKLAARRASPPWDDEDRTQYLLDHLGAQAKRTTATYFLRIEEEEGTPPTFGELVAYLSRVFEQIVTPEQKINDLLDYTRARSTSFDRYVMGFQRRVEELPSAIHRSPGDKFFVSIFRQGLSSEARDLWTACPRLPTTWKAVAELIREHPGVVQSMDRPEERTKSSARNPMGKSNKALPGREQGGGMASNKGASLVCYACGEEGHIARRCPHQRQSLVQLKDRNDIEGLVQSLKNLHISDNPVAPVRSGYSYYYDHKNYTNKKIKIEPEVTELQKAVRLMEDVVITTVDKESQNKVKVLVDTGAYLPLVIQRCVRRLQIPTFELPEEQYRGISGERISANRGVKLCLQYEGKTYTFAAYITPLELEIDVIVGTTTMGLLPEFLQIVTRHLADASRRLRATENAVEMTEVKGHRDDLKRKSMREGSQKTESTEAKCDSNDEAIASNYESSTEGSEIWDEMVSESDTQTSHEGTPIPPVMELEGTKGRSVRNKQEENSKTPTRNKVETDLREQQISSRLQSHEDWICHMVSKPDKTGNEDKGSEESNLPDGLQEKYKDTVTNVLNSDNIVKRTVYHEIELVKGTRVPKLQPYRQTAKEKEITRKIVAELLEQGFIVPSKAPGSSPVVLVKKKDNSYRLCVDYRELNKITVSDPFPLPRIEEMLACIGDAKVFSTLDLHSGYHQIPMRKEDRAKTAFVTSEGKYEYLVMPFGLMNAPSTFARYMSEIFRGLRFVAVYLGDLLVYSLNEQEHIYHLAVVLGKLKEHGLIAEKKKCRFHVNKVEFLGYEVSDKGIRPLSHKCEAIKLLKMPQTVKQAQRFLGLVNYYRRFIPNCSLITRPLQRFIAGKEKWTKRHTEAVKHTKTLLSSEPILVKFKTQDLNANYVLTTDASKEGVGAVLEEVDEKGKVLGVVEYFSKSFNDVQSRYPAGELELLGIMEALRHFKYLLHGRKFKIKTDHLGLLTTQNKGEPHRRVARWLDELEEYDFTLSYLKGPDNVVADVLSRDVRRIYMVEEATIRPSLWTEEYKADPFSIAVLKTLKKKFKPRMEGNDVNIVAKYMEKMKKSEIFRNKMSFKDDVIYYENRIIVPRSKVQEVLNIYHDHFLTGGHFGIEATYNKIALYYYWPKMSRDVKEYVRTCTDCQIRKHHRPNSQGKIMPLPQATGRWKELSMDFLTGIPESVGGNDMILVVVDRFSKYAWFIPCKKTITGEQVFQLLAGNIFSHKGVPDTLVSDRDIRFEGKKYQELTKGLGIKLLRSTAGHPQTDGQTERVMQPLTRLLKQYAQSPNWDTHLWHVQIAYNNAYNQAIKDMPARVANGYLIIDPCVDARADSGNQNLEPDQLAKLLEVMNARIKDQLEENL
ncbi:uncharacterized protein Ecym_5175 [Eremothecium cymbalariae DBVPG|uniref:Uncharacterized protein n=1 Tax=Eremothecium cymbalariae (strain CBS 270.75 / DBVPG 7215 / KCTC 17166 / NRRL Y-17582) TaxID=931890 RepID=I6ND06_ERECY|nr:hypothetical protein Ecym_5175 [Eremothecium cymbalariae DBVPG\